MLSDTLELTLRKALSIASSYKHEYATYEHLLLALLDDIDAKAALLESNIDVKSIAIKLISYLKTDLIELVNEDTKESKPTAGFQRIVQRAALHSQATGQKSINGANLLAEFFFERDSYALTCLQEANLKRNDISAYLKKYTKKTSNNSNSVASQKDSKQQISLATAADLAEVGYKLKSQTSKNTHETAPELELEKYCVNLNSKASENDIDCLIGRQAEIQRTIEILCRRKKNNAILVGQPGVGKTAIAEGLAIRIVKGDVPSILKDAVIYSLDIGSLVAGTKFRGDFEERIKLMLDALKKIPTAILFIDEIHSIIGAGSTTSGALDASNLLKPALAGGDIRCIGSTTFKEYHNHFEKDMALVRRFQKVVVEEPDEESTFKILQGLKGYYEEHHNVTYADSALRAAITLSERYINDRHLPDKAIDLMDEAGARTKTDPTVILAKAGTQGLKNEKKDPRFHEDDALKKMIITDKDIEALIVSILNIPDLTLEIDDLKQIKALEGKLKNSIFGQDEAIESLCNSIKLSKAGLKKGRRPTGCYLFVGSTGVGKTELAKQLAFFCSMKLLKYDMSEFSESSAVAKLVGSAPGYVGFDQGGMLTDEVDKYPYSVILFDEIEKAHGEIYSLLLQIMDEGVLTDSTGKKITFSHSIIILTSNLAVSKTKASIGFGSSANSSGVDEFDMGAINAEFSPEFRSRLDKIILFNPIDGIVDKIVNKNLKELAAQLADKKVRISISTAAKKHFAQRCFKDKNGARVLDRVIDTEIKQPIAEAILFGKLKNGGAVEVDYSKKEQKIIFKFSGIDKKISKELESV